jgi:hypothetical protein
VIHEDHIRTVVVQVMKRGFGGFGGSNVEVVYLEHAFEHDSRRSGIVDNQRALSHWFSLGVTDPDFDYVTQ